MIKNKIKPVLLLATISFFLIAANFAGNNYIKNQFDNNSNSSVFNYPSIAGNHIPILIDGNAALAIFIGNEGLSGDGTYASPYIIEAFTINASTANGIEIRNTDAYLIIRDCIIENGNSTGYVGIYLYNTANVNISNNELIDNVSGILLSYSNNNTISGNNARYNNERGIYLSDSSNNTLSGNNASYNNWCGINLEYSGNNTLSENIARYNKEHGILLWYSNYSTLSGNTANYNTWIGIHLEYSSNNTLSENNASFNTWCGIYLYHMINNTLSGNTVNYNTWLGIYLEGSINNTLFGNNVYYNTWIGISLDGSINNTLFGNNASYNIDRGINLSFSSNNTLSGNNANYNSWCGIILSYSSNSILFGNNASLNNERGIYLSDSSKNTLSENNVNNNVDGIYLKNSSTSTLSKNNINNNVDGITLSSSSNNNVIYFNEIYGNSHDQASEDNDCTDNQWDNGTIGNYWGNDYIINYPDATNDGTVWNIPYKIDNYSEGIDNFPLVNSNFPEFEAPQFTDVPADFSNDEGYSGLSISWTIIDTYPATYTIELDGIEVVSATVWNSGIIISYNIPDELLEGTYIITIIVSDESGITTQDTVIFTVNSIDPTDDKEFKIAGFPLINLLFFISVGVYILRRKIR